MAEPMDSQRYTFSEDAIVLKATKKLVNVLDAVPGNRCAVSLRLSSKASSAFHMVERLMMVPERLADMRLIQYLQIWQPCRQRKTSFACILTFKSSCNYLAKLITILDTTLGMI